MVYLKEKGRISSDAYSLLVSALNDSVGVFEELPVTQHVISKMAEVTREEVPDLPDRIVAATGIYLQVPVISRDGRIRASRVATIW